MARAKQDRQRKRRVREAEQRLMQKLIGAHGLRRRERRLLGRVVKDLELPYPSIIFFKPSVLGDYVKTRRDTLPRSKLEALKRIAGLLFADYRPRELMERGAVGDDGLPRRFVPEEVGGVPSGRESSVSV